ncbi:hypothetical protein FT663_02551 [Candidozyma haemuli var. vulneris]|uniref:Transcription elongation factor Eaf N-terminal domain-containing protein n=1 Tax=Candidozyma haemuli TaxID=45357 RepID=A0A2V1AY37_9ASCO|nr:hypothetical protein CXQ85_004995 [[Candida] haemuloni]KAF3986886.1 hypothetical protein FT662_04298 [[Candida] haemuloni var. vulneris]KAF3991800.1 hypothetical protein FT663_02551 [[Candida] haemuloni var. vulneris]PVH22426.1 hypothetical protein CXQ85_004995 [[Candida] haemuloni]
MHIPDGEYDIDLSVLAYAGDSPDSAAGSSSNGPLALRYGFVPDSMSQTSPLKLYRDDQTCVLEAQSSSKLHKTGKAPSVIFEGIQQRQRPSGANGPGPGPDSYYLAFQPPASENGTVKVSLQQLANTIRMSKSRNAEKWRDAIVEWQKAPEDGIHIPKVKKETPALRKSQDKASARPQQPKKKSPQQQQAVAKSEPKKRAAKRPPAATPESKDIINMEDFEDLESDAEQPDLMAGSALKEVKAPAKQSEPKRQEQERKKPKAARQSKKAKKESGDVDMDDDFKDLEDQLQEVLESTPSESSPNTFGNTFSESDEDDEDDDDGRGSQKIVINMTDEPEPSKKPIGRNGPGSQPNGKPMSLRELYGGSKTEDFSSSEEE